MFCFQSGFLDTKIPPLILVFIFAGFMWLVHLWNIPYFAAPHSVAFLQNMMVMIMSLVGCLLPILGVISFRKANTTVDPRDPSRSAQLVVSGVYRITRNPMYLGFLCWLIAFCIFH